METCVLTNIENVVKMNVAAFQFAGSRSIADNIRAIERGVKQAALQNARLFVTQECALCGYPSLEVESVQTINNSEQLEAVDYIKHLATRHRMYIALGHITYKKKRMLNTVTMVSPEENGLPAYHKRALWGWDAENFTPGNNTHGVYTIDGMRVGVRICYEVRFPEYFRELFTQNVDLAIVPFADVGPKQQRSKYEVMRSHLVTRATENAMYVLSANSISQTQLAPTCLIDQDGRILATAPLDEEYVLVGTVRRETPNFGRTGRIAHAQELILESSFHSGNPALFAARKEQD
jgi:predicted amidohydrolase